MVADRGIHARVGPGGRKALCRDMEASFRSAQCAVLTRRHQVHWCSGEAPLAAFSCARACPQRDTGRAGGLAVSRVQRSHSATAAPAFGLAGAATAARLLASKRLGRGGQLGGVTCRIQGGDEGLSICRQSTAYLDVAGLQIYVHLLDATQCLQGLSDVLDARVATHTLDFKINCVHVQTPKDGDEQRVHALRLQHGAAQLSGA